MKLSVITISYNNLAGLQLTVASVLSQVDSPQQLIIVDGGSTDGSAEWLRSQEFPRFVEFTSEPDKGIYDAMNKGISRVVGDQVLFLNSGDRFASERTTRQVLDTFPDGTAWAFGESSMVDGDSVVGRHRLRRPKRLRFLSGISTIPHQSTFVSAEMTKRLGGFNDSFGLSADQEFLLRVWRNSDPHVFPFLVSVCDVNGVSANRPPGAYAREMQGYRKANDMSFRFVDGLWTSFAIGFDHSRVWRTRLRVIITSVLTRRL